MKNFQDIRNTFTNYFANKDHKIIKSSSVIPENDPSLMFVNSGMVQFKDIFLGLKKSEFNNATTIQKSLRAGGKHNDLDNVGYTTRHHTFFEMLGNFSFGGYFKEQAIKHAWDFLTKEISINPDKLYITVYHTDQEAFDIWKKLTGFSESKIIKISTNDNFWQMAETGPCGPCSEIYYDYGDSVKGGLPGSADQDGDRFCEIWNLVFMQYERLKNGELVELKQKCVDTGMGLERLASVLEGKTDNFQTSLFSSLIQKSEEIFSAKDQKFNINHRIIADHIRSASFLISEGLTPSNESRGYVLRRIMRRAMRYANEMSPNKALLSNLTDRLNELMSEQYPEISQNIDTIKQTIKAEEESFKENLSRGIGLICKEFGINNTSEINSTHSLSGSAAFKLYDTYGFPIDMSSDIMRRSGGSIDVDGFDMEMQEQKNRSKKSWKGAEGFQNEQIFKIDNIKQNVDFNQNESQSKILKIIKNYEFSDNANELATDKIWILFDNLCLYPEGGGQESDHGYGFKDNEKILEIIDVQKKSGLVFCKISNQKNISVGDILALKPDNIRRRKLKNGHTATHLLQSALKKIVNPDAKQMGSKIYPDYLRFDFNSSKNLSADEIKKIEDYVNNIIISDINVCAIEDQKKEDAIQLGAVANFGDKYEDLVRIIKIKDQSMELCGGMHASRTTEIQGFKILKSYGISSGIYRIEAITGETENHSKIMEISKILECDTTEINAKIIQLIEKNKLLEKNNQELIIKHLSINPENIVNKNGLDIYLLYHENQDSKFAKDVSLNCGNKIGDKSCLITVFNNLNSSSISIFSKSSEISAINILNNITQSIAQIKSGGGNEKFAMSGLKTLITRDDLIEIIKKLL
jgi:alanyl-tRNA synthetase